jgi:hypothetical protein
MGCRLAIILDNASIHRSGKATRFLSRHHEAKLFLLSIYSPWYAPIEQVWKWIKPLICEFRSIENDLAELLHRIRRPPAIGLGFWKRIFVNQL